jgi:hypothetical protein
MIGGRGFLAACLSTDGHDKRMSWPTITQPNMSPRVHDEALTFYMCMKI